LADLWAGTGVCFIDPDGDARRLENRSKDQKGRERKFLGMTGVGECRNGGKMKEHRGIYLQGGISRVELLRQQGGVS